MAASMDEIQLREIFVDFIRASKVYDVRGDNHCVIANKLAVVLRDYLAWGARVLVNDAWSKPRLYSHLSDIAALLCRHNESVQEPALVRHPCCGERTSKHPEPCVCYSGELAPGSLPSGALPRGAVPKEAARGACGAVMRLGAWHPGGGVA